MKTIICLILTSLLSFANVQGSEYLKIVFNNGNTSLKYPPGTSFILKDQDGNMLLNEDDLKELKEFTIDQEYDLYVFKSWNSKPDYFLIKEGKILLRDSSEIKLKKKVSQRDGRKTYGDPIAIKEKRLYASDKEKGSNLSLVFDNGIVFSYQDGKANARLEGKELSIEGKYIINSKLGVLKLSYNPITTDVWYVFEAK